MKDVIVCDLDGVVWLTGVPIPGSVEAIRRLWSAGCRVVFVTNSSAPTLGDHTAALARIGLPADGEVISSATAVSSLLQPGERVLVAGGAGIAEAVAAADAVAFQGNDAGAVAEGVDVVVAGLHRDFDYERLQLATTAIRNGARFVAANRDPLYPTPDGPIPGGGSIVAAIATATGVEPVTAGKPNPPMVDAVRRQLGLDDEALRQRVVVVGDQVSTDGRLAASLGCRFAMVRTGYTHPGMELVPPPDLDGADLAAIADLLLGTRPAAPR
jgi:4-nitrophenyl phosphatase